MIVAADCCKSNLHDERQSFIFTNLLHTCQLRPCQVEKFFLSIEVAKTILGVVENLLEQLEFLPSDDMATFESQFAAFSKYGDTKSDGSTITLTQSDKWMKQAKVLDKKVTTTDTAIYFGKLKQKTLGFSDYNKFVRDLATSKGLNPKDVFDKMTTCGLPGSSNVTQAASSNIVDRLTDTTKYTGAHKERFDESGRGRGAEGRSDATSNNGYVQGYKHKDTYDETH